MQIKRIKDSVKKNYKLIVGIIFGILTTSAGVYASTAIDGKELEYNNVNSNLSATNVQDAIDEIYINAKTNCPEGYECIKKICKRATTLHTEECSQTDSTNYCSGAGYTESGSKATTTITYGSTGTAGTLTSGDAFDCDVNDDGTYDAATERFYYVTDMDEETAVLIYYNNVSGGVASNSKKSAYDSSNKNNNGPVTAILQLPTTEQWKNISLTNTSRTITNESGGTITTAGDLPASFSYLGYAARLLTAQEVNSACGITVGDRTIGELDSCNYLMENTIYSDSSLTYGYWLETPVSSSSYNVCTLRSTTRAVDVGSANETSYRAVRPVIEVLKSNISY